MRDVSSSAISRQQPHRDRPTVANGDARIRNMTAPAALIGSAARIEQAFNNRTESCKDVVFSGRRGARRVWETPGGLPFGAVLIVINDLRVVV